MGKCSKALVICMLFVFRSSMAQVPEVKPRVLTKLEMDGKVAVVEVAAHFVTAIRMPETVNSVVVGDPTLFKVEHSDREPQLVFVKALTEKPAESNLLISTTHGREASLLLVSRGEQKSNDPENVDLLLNYKPAKGFLIEPDYPSALVAKTVEVGAPSSDCACPQPLRQPAQADRQAMSSKRPPSHRTHRMPPHRRGWMSFLPGRNDLRCRRSTANMCRQKRPPGTECVLA